MEVFLQVLDGEGSTCIHVDGRESALQLMKSMEDTFTREHGGCPLRESYSRIGKGTYTVTGKELTAGDDSLKLKLIELREDLQG